MIRQHIRRLRSHRRQGFTLVDLTITVLLLGVISAVAAPRFSSVATDYRVKAAARRVAGDLNFAARAALNFGQPVTVTFYQGSQTYVFDGLNDPDHPTSLWTVSLTESGYGGCSFSGVSVGGDLSVTFDIYGRPDSSGSVTLACGNATQIISIDQATGRASLP